MTQIFFTYSQEHLTFFMNICVASWKLYSSYSNNAMMGMEIFTSSFISTRSYTLHNDTATLFYRLDVLSMSNKRRFNVHCLIERYLNVKTITCFFNKKPGEGLSSKGIFLYIVLSVSYKKNCINIYIIYTFLCLVNNLYIFSDALLYKNLRYCSVYKFHFRSCIYPPSPMCRLKQCFYHLNLIPTRAGIYLFLLLCFQNLKTELKKSQFI